MRRRIIAMLMAIVMLVGNVPVQAFATEAEPQETLACVTEGCTYGADHTGECSTFVACGKDGCTYAADHEGNCSTYVAPEAPRVEAASDAAVYVTVSNRGQLGMAYEEVTVSDINQDGKLTVDEALYAAHTVYGKGYASEDGTVTRLWDEDTSNVSFFLNHKPLSTDVSADTVSDGDYLVASVDQDAVNDYDKYSRFNILETSAKAGEAIHLTLTDDAGNALAGMEIGLWSGSGTNMTGLTTDGSGSVTLTLDQEGLYCVTARGTVVESSIDVDTLEMTSIETPIIAPVCVVTVSGSAQQPLMAAAEEAAVQTPAAASYAVSTVAEGDTDLTVTGATVTMAPASTVGPLTLTSFEIYKQNAYPEAPAIVSATQNGTTVNVTLAEDTDPAYPLQLGFASTGSGVLRQSGNTCTLSEGQGTMSVVLQVYPGFGAPQPTAQATYTVNFTIPMGTAYTVTPPTGEGFTFTGKETVYEGKDYTFTVSVSEGYDGSGMLVKVNGEEVTGTDGSYTVSAVSQNLEITVEGIVKKELCSVTLTEGEGYTISSDDTPYKGESYTFAVTPDSVNYKADTLQVLVDGEEITGENGVYTIPALQQDHVVTVNLAKKAVYTVTKNSQDGVTITGADTVLETDPYTFRVAVDNAYDASGMKVLVNDQEITLQEDGSYTIESAAENITITVTGVAAKVIYKVTLTEGENYTISGQTTSYAGEPYTFTVTVDDAIYKADEILVKVNEEAVNLTDGKYTIESLAGDTTVTVENVVERQLFTVTKPEAEGVTVTGEETVREGKPYTFSVAVNDGYDGTNLQVTVNEEAVTLTDGSYTVESVSGNLTIAVSGVTAKVLCSITLTSGKGYTISGAATAYAGDSYSFTVSVNPGYTGENMTVTANGTPVSGTDGTYTIILERDTAVEVIGVEREALPATELTVSDNVIDITDKTVYSLMSSIYAKATNIQISGATVTEAYENGTTVYVILGQDTADDGSVNISFGTALKSCTMEGTTGSVTLNGGEGSKTMTLTGKWSNSRKGTATYTLIFFRDEPSATPPVLVKSADTAEVYQKRTLTVNLEDYFTDADSYYLVTEAGNTALEGSTYSITPSEPGTLTLVFAAANEAGESPEKLTVTVTVKEIEGGIWLDYTTSNGSVNYVTFTDANGNPIDGIDISCEGKKISVVLPKTYDLSGTVTATFNRTANDSGLPFLSSSNAFNHGTGSRVDVYTNTLTNGAATRSVYLYNAVPKAVSNVYETITISYTIKNELPTLTEGVSAAAEATITAGENYTLDLSPLFTDADADALTYLVSIDGAAAVAADASYSYTTDTAGTYTLVFTANDGKGTSIATYTVTLTVKNSEEKKSMTVRVPEGLEPSFYVSTGYGEDGLDMQDAAIQAEKGETADGLTAYALRYPANASLISVRTEDWGGMAFAAEADSTVTVRQVQFNVKDYEGNAAESTNTVTYEGHTAAPGTKGWLLATGTEYTFQAVPADTASLTTVTKTETLEAAAEVYTLDLTLGMKDPITITVTTGAKAQLYKYDTNRYYVASELTAKIVQENEDGTTTYSFVGNTKESGSCFIYRVSMPGKITKAGYLGWGKQSIAVTYAADDQSNTYRLDDYSTTGQANSALAEDSVVLNVNGQNHLAMNVGDSKTLKAYRVWELIKISYQNYIITPDFTFSILSGSDVISLTEKDSPSVGEGDWMTLTALKEGTAVIEVTYDAMEIAGGSYDGIYGATDPARTGLVIVQVGGNDTSVDFGIESFASRGTSGSKNVTYNPNNKRAWDAEFDTLYFTDSSGQLKLSPTASGAITQVAVSHNKGGSWNILTAEEGVYTAPIASGNNILRITTETGVAYQVVRGDKVSVQVTEQTGDGDGKMEPGETVRVALKGLHMPIPKMAGNYNPGFVSNTDGYSPVHLNYTANGQAVYGPGSQYTFITAANYLDIAIPEDIQTDKLTLTDGYIGVGVLGLTQFDVGGDSHRNIPDSGCTTRDSQTTFHTRSILPEITVSLDGVKVPVPVTGVTLDKSELTLNVGDTETLTATVLPENADNKTVTWSSDDLTVARAVDGSITAVGAGTTTVTVTTEDGSFTASCEVTVKQPVESVSVTPESAEVEVGKTVELTAAVLPENASDKTVTWKSSDETVATVENGLVTGVKEGTVTITAAAGELSATCTVTVKEIPEAAAEVYLSVSHDAEFLTTDTGHVMALKKVSVPYFDLAPYGLGDFNLPGSHADYGKPTMLHLYIYATELFQYGVAPEAAGKGYLMDYIGSDMFAVSGAPGSICLDKFWGYDMNLNYYHNYVYPADESGYGITADRVPLKNGDIVTIGHFTSWSFFGDSSSIFNYIAAGSDTVVTTAAQNETPALQIYRAGPNLGGTGSNTPREAALDIYYVKADSLFSGDVTSWTKLGTTDAAGKLTADLSDLSVGQYILAVAGQKGVDYPDDIVSTPGGIVLNVTESTLGTAVQKVINQIKAIGEVTLDSEEAIAAAREAYDALNEDQKTLVTNTATLTAAEAKLASLKTDKAAADAVAEIIDAIGEVTLESEEAIQKAREAYDALTEDQKTLVTNTATLTAAEAKLAALKADKAAADAVAEKIDAIGKVTLNSEEAITAARAAYNALTEDQKTLVTNTATLTAAEEKLATLQADKAAADAVIEKIDAIGEVTLDSEEVIAAARAAYDALTEDQKTLVTNTATLTAAEAKLAALKADKAAADAVVEKINAIGEVALDSEEAITAARTAYDGLTAAQKELVTNLQTLTEAEAKLAALKADKAAADAVVEKIDAIGEVTLESEQDIKEAEEAYNALTDTQKESVTNYDKLTAAQKAWADLVSTEADKTKAAEVKALIEAIGDVTLDSETKIREARAAYEALTDVQKPFVDNLKTLTEAEVKLAALKADKAAADAVVEKIDAIGEVTLDSEEAITAARTAFDALTKDQKSLVTNEDTLTEAEAKLAALKADKAAADEVVEKIDAIGEVTLDSEEAITAAREAYDALTAAQKELVTNLQTLTEAEAKLAALKADKATVAEVIAKIDAIGEVTLESEEVIAAARTAYDALTEDQKSLVTNVDILTAAEEKLADLKAAQEVQTQIDAIGEVTLDSKEAIAAAREAFDALTEDQKALVTNADTLTAAEEILAALETVEADKEAAQSVVNQIEAIDAEITEESEADIVAAREAYDDLTDAQKAYVTNYSDLLAAEEELRYLKLSNADIARIYRTTGDYLAGLEAPGVGSINGEWRVIGLKRSGRAVADAYYEAVVAYVQNNIDTSGRLHAGKSSDNSRIILALTALGKDVTDVGGHNLLAGLNEMDYIRNQGINGVIWALIAFDSHDYPTPEGITREDLINAILEAQLSDGGWALAGKVSDPDMTGMALQALAPYCSANAQVQTAVEAALTMLSEKQNADGTFTGSEGTTCESLAQVITALTALGIDPERDARFVKNNVSALDALAAFYVEEGGFRHGLTTDRNMMATEQGYYALVSYFRLLEGKTSLYDMSDVVLAEKLVKDVEDLIDAIGDVVTKDSKAAIENAREAYEALDDTLKSKVNNLAKLEEAEKAYDQLMVQEVMDKIDAIGQVTLDSEQDIQEAEEAYEALTDAQKEAVTNYSKLTEAQRAWADLVSTEADKAEAAKVKALIDAIGDVTLDSEAQIREAREAYEALTDVQKPYVDNLETLKTAEATLTDLKNQKAADDVEALIDNIGTVELTTACENAINAARRAYNALTTIQKGKVDAEHLKTLTDAEANLAALKDQAAADAVKQKINAIGSTITLGSETKIKDARNAYDALTAARKALVTNYQTLVKAEEALNKLKATVSVTFSLLGCYKHGTGETAVHTLAGGNLQTWISAKTYNVQPGATVKDLFEQALKAAGLTWKNPTGNYVESITRNGVTIGEFTNGANSGWMYTLNGKHPGLGVNQQTLVSGDKVVFHYSDDFTKEEGNPSGSTTGTTTGTSTGTVSGYTNYITTTTSTVNAETAESVDRLIEDIGEEITLDSEAKILAARAAYDKLTDAQKELVENYDILVAAEAELARLKGEVSEDIYLVTGDYLQNLGTPGVGNIGGEWMVIGLARSGRPVPTGYYDHVVNYVRENINEKQQLHSAKSSDNSRLILALTSIGKDVTDVDGHNLLQGLSDMDYVRKQGINGPIWALMAFDSGNYPVPVDGNVSREALIDVILEAQLSDGGWALSGERSDPDMTGMAIQALAPYMDSSLNVKKAVEEAVWTLSEMQNDNGSYSSIDGPNSESIAQVIVALAALGIDADTDARFVKNGISALDALASYYIPGGGFRHILEGNLDGMSTEQAYYALTAYHRMRQNQTFLYDMTDVIDAGGDVAVEETTEPTQVPTEPVEEEGGKDVVIWTGIMGICAAAIALLLLNRKKLFGKF